MKVEPPAFARRLDVAYERGVKNEFPFTYMRKTGDSSLSSSQVFAGFSY